MSNWIAELEQLLRQLLEAHHAWLGSMSEYERVLRSFNAAEIEKASKKQQSQLAVIQQLEKRRQFILTQLARQHRAAGSFTLEQLAQTYPQRKLILLQMRQELREVLERVKVKNEAAARVASSALGNLNTALRVIASKTGNAATYDRNGSTVGATVNAARLKSIEAVA
jgi:flagellar biosynthesis/type III secretory pathway chaperone